MILVFWTTEVGNPPRGCKDVPGGIAVIPPCSCHHWEIVSVVSVEGFSDDGQPLGPLQRVYWERRGLLAHIQTKEDECPCAPKGQRRLGGM